MDSEITGARLKRRKRNKLGLAVAWIHAIWRARQYRERRFTYGVFPNHQLLPTVKPKLKKNVASGAKPLLSGNSGSHNPARQPERRIG